MGLAIIIQPAITFKSLSLESLQHHGENMIQLVTHFGNDDLTQTHEGNQVFFNILGSNMITYSDKLVIPIMVLTVILFAVTVVHGYRLKKLSLFRNACRTFCFHRGDHRVLCYRIRIMVYTHFYFYGSRMVDGNRKDGWHPLLHQFFPYYLCFLGDPLLAGS